MQKFEKIKPEYECATMVIGNSLSKKRKGEKIRLWRE